MGPNASSAKLVAACVSLAATVMAFGSPTSRLPWATPSATRLTQSRLVGGSISNPNASAVMPEFMVSQQEFRFEFAIQVRAVDVLRGVQENSSVWRCADTVYEEHYHNVTKKPLHSF